MREKDPLTGRAKLDFPVEGQVIADNPLPDPTPDPFPRAADPEPVPVAELNAMIADVETQVTDSPIDNSRALDRRHIQQLREAGATKSEVLELADKLVTGAGALRLAEDLDSYGVWSG